MLKIDYTLFIQIANFLFLLFILNILLFRPIRKILGRRAEEINSSKGMMGDFQNRAARYEKELEENIAGARREGYKEKEDLKDEGLEQEKELLKDATSSSGEKIGKAKQQIKSSADHVRQSLENEVAVFSRELAEKILGRSI
jgi:F-type H+-transporting ATPase subunit b